MQAERALRQKTSSLNELTKLSGSAAKAKDSAERSLTKAQDRDAKGISLSEDLKFDLRETDIIASFTPAEVDDPKRVRKIVS